MTEPEQKPPPRIAFFPWLRLPSEIAIGRFRLIKYDRDLGTPGLTPEVHARVRATLKTHRWFGGTELESAVLVEVDGKIVVNDFSNALSEEVFELREVLAFCGLASRWLYGQDFNYTNRSTFFAMVAPLATEHGFVAVASRGRSGRRLHGWDRDHLVTIIPAHANTAPTIDKRLLEALWSARSGEHWTALLDVIHYFNAANTDSDDIDESFEMVLTVAAVQRLLGSMHRLDAAVRELGAAFGFVHDLRVERARAADIDGPSRRKVPVRRVTDWWTEVHKLRGGQAHGARRPSSIHRTREDFEHLLLAAWFVPRLVKVKLHEWGLYRASDDDFGEFEAFPAMLGRPHSSPRTKDPKSSFERSPCDRIINRCESRWRHIAIMASYREKGYVEGVTKKEDGTGYVVDVPVDYDDL